MCNWNVTQSRSEVFLTLLNLIQETGVRIIRFLVIVYILIFREYSTLWFFVCVMTPVPSLFLSITFNLDKTWLAIIFMTYNFTHTLLLSTFISHSILKPINTMFCSLRFTVSIQDHPYTTVGVEVQRGGFWYVSLFLLHTFVIIICGKTFWSSISFGRLKYRSHLKPIFFRVVAVFISYVYR